MITTVTQKNMVTIPAEVARKFGIKPGYKLDWQPVEGKDEIVVKIIPDRGELARRVEKPFCEQLKVMGWQWIEGDTDVPELTERDTFREVLLKGRLTAALRKLNLRDGQPWLDDVRIARAIRDLE